jgi:glutamyl-tRNA synthetase
VEWFDLGSVGRSPARFDLDKLLQINAHYLRQCDNRDLADQVLARLTAANGRRPAAHAQQRLGRAMDGLKVRAKTLTDLAERSAFCAFDGPVPIEPAAATLLTAEARRHLAALRPALERSPEWRAEDLERSVRDYVQQAGTPALKLKDVAQPLRASLTGAAVSPPIFEVMEILGRDETLVRLTASLGGDAGAYA